eukprot:gene14385-biopygen2765
MGPMLEARLASRWPRPPAVVGCGPCPRSVRTHHGPPTTFLHTQRNGLLTHHPRLPRLDYSLKPLHNLWPLVAPMRPGDWSPPQQPNHFALLLVLTPALPTVVAPPPPPQAHSAQPPVAPEQPTAQWPQARTKATRRVSRRVVATKKTGGEAAAGHKAGGGDAASGNASIAGLLYHIGLYQVHGAPAAPTLPHRAQPGGKWKRGTPTPSG